MEIEFAVAYSELKEYDKSLEYLNTVYEKAIRNCVRWNALYIEMPGLQTLVGATGIQTSACQV